MRKRLAYFAQHSCIKDHSAKVTYTFYVMLHHLKADPGRVGTHVELRKLDILEFPWARCIISAWNLALYHMDTPDTSTCASTTPRLMARAIHHSTCMLRTTNARTQHAFYQTPVLQHTRVLTPECRKHT